MLVGILTRRHPIYRFNGRWSTATALLRGRLKPHNWSAPPWVLQESGYALKGNKQLILFCEADVEIPGLQADLEYIPYDPQAPTPAFLRATQMILDLIAKAGNVRVETIVEADSTQPKGSDAAQRPPAEAEPPRAEVAENELMVRQFELIRLLQDRNWEQAQRGYEEGLKWVGEHEPERELFWKCFYQSRLFEVGRPDGLAELRRLASQHQDKALPLTYIARCLSDLGEYSESAKYYLEAALASKPEYRASCEIRASEALQKAKKDGEAREILLRLLRADYAQASKTQVSILQHLYSMFKESADKFAAFGVAELALHSCPEDSDFRFSVAFDYEEADQNHLSLYHYKILCENDDTNSAALNNLGVASTKSGLPVLAAQHYKGAYKLGDTLSASNLAYKYLEAGLSDDAITLLREAQGKANCAPEVYRTLAAVHEKIKEDGLAQDKILARATDFRAFLLSFAEGILSTITRPVDGRWGFPSVQIELTRARQKLSGSKEIKTPIDPLFGFNAITGATAPTSAVRTESFEFTGVLTGRTCKFKLVSTKSEEPQTVRTILSGATGSQAIEGYIVFREDGNTGWVAELKDGRPEKYYEILRITDGLRAIAGD